MSNTYYKYSKRQVDKGFKSEQVRTSTMELSLTAYIDGSPNTLQLTLLTQEDNVRFDSAYITLTQQEQDDLICGILERRGIPPSITKEFLATAARYDGGISATGYEQSLVHPAEPKTTDHEQE